MGFKAIQGWFLFIILLWPVVFVHGEGEIGEIADRRAARIRRQEQLADRIIEALEQFVQNPSGQHGIAEFLELIERMQQTEPMEYEINRRIHDREQLVALFARGDGNWRRTWDGLTSLLLEQNLSGITPFRFNFGNELLASINDFLNRSQGARRNYTEIEAENALRNANRPPPNRVTDPNGLRALQRGIGFLTQTENPLAPSTRGTHSQFEAFETWRRLQIERIQQQVNHTVRESLRLMFRYHQPTLVLGNRPISLDEALNLRFESAPYGHIVGRDAAAGVSGDLSVQSLRWDRSNIFFADSLSATFGWTNPRLLEPAVENVEQASLVIAGYHLHFLFSVLLALRSPSATPEKVKQAYENLVREFNSLRSLRTARVNTVWMILRGMVDNADVRRNWVHQARQSDAPASPVVQEAWRLFRLLHSGIAGEMQHGQSQNAATASSSSSFTELGRPTNTSFNNMGQQRNTSLFHVRRRGLFSRLQSYYEMPTHPLDLSTHAERTWTPTGASVNSSVERLVPQEPLGGVVPILRPEHSELATIEVRDARGNGLTRGTDFEIIHVPDRHAYFIRLLGGRSAAITYTAGFRHTSERTLPTLPASLQNLNREVLSALIRELAQSGFSALSHELETAIRNSRGNFSIHDLALVFTREARYSYYPENQGVDTHGLLGSLRGFIGPEGRRCIQCDGADSGFGNFLREFFQRAGIPFTVESRRGYFRRGNVIAELSHARTFVFAGNSTTPLVFDTTPDTPDPRGIPTRTADLPQPQSHAEQSGPPPMSRSQRLALMRTRLLDSLNRLKNYHEELLSEMNRIRTDNSPSNAVARNVVSHWNVRDQDPLSKLFKMVRFLEQHQDVLRNANSISTNIPTTLQELAQEGLRGLQFLLSEAPTRHVRNRHPIFQLDSLSLSERLQIMFNEAGEISRQITEIARISNAPHTDDNARPYTQAAGTVASPCPTAISRFGGN